MENSPFKSKNLKMDLRQSLEYVNYLKSLGWQVEKITNGQVFIKRLPLIGSLIKIQRTKSLDFEEIEKVAQKYRAFKIILEPFDEVYTERDRSAQDKPSDYKRLKSPFIPTKTIILDLKRPEPEIFDSFSKNKRRDIRIAERKNLIINQGCLEDFLKLKKDYLLKKFILPIGVKKDLGKLIRAFGEKSKILIAYPSGPSHFSCPYAGVLLLFHDKICYYWQAAATETGKKTLAPTLLVWEAIKLAKKLKCEVFDFEGVYDPRFPQLKSWQGFTHFKEGFRGKEVVYPRPLAKNFGLFKFFG